MLALYHAKHSVAASNVSAAPPNACLLNQLLFVFLCIILDICEDPRLHQFVIRLIVAIRLHGILHLHFLIEIKVAVNRFEEVAQAQRGVRP